MAETDPYKAMAALSLEYQAVSADEAKLARRKEEIRERMRQVAARLAGDGSTKHAGSNGTSTETRTTSALPEGAPDLSFPPSDIEFDACDDPEGVRADCEAALAASVK
jgi:hypothetical protein